MLCSNGQHVLPTSGGCPVFVCVPNLSSLCFGSRHVVVFFPGCPKLNIVALSSCAVYVVDVLHNIYIYRYIELGLGLGLFVAQTQLHGVSILCLQKSMHLAVVQMTLQFSCFRLCFLAPIGNSVSVDQDYPVVLPPGL